MTNIYKVLFMVIYIFSTLIFAQKFTITGLVTSKSSGEGLYGANVYLKGTDIGCNTDEHGKYKIVAEKGEYTILCSYIGYETVSEKIDLSINIQKNFTLKDRQLTLSVMEISDRAIDRETPVAFSDVTQAEMDTRLGSQDIPMILNTTPSVYATEQGGGAGDSRIDIRGFKQNDIAVMLNGVPINDMDDGWVYWSDWDGLGDLTSSLQVQRGLTAVNLALPSIGGTINIITDPAQSKFGVKFKQEYGAGDLLKSSLLFNSGMIGDKFAFNGSVVHKTGNGVVDATWRDSWSYYFGASYNINENNRLELYALGAPQEHGQNSYEQNIAAYDSGYAKSIPGFDPRAIQKFPQSPSGRLYNENWNFVSPSYTGLQFWDGETHSRHNSNYLNEKENYYNKPMVNLNWFTDLSKVFSLFSTIYYSGGDGGGSTTYGTMKWIQPPGSTGGTVPSEIVDWNGTITKNESSRFGSLGILANAVNNQWTYGALSKAYYKISDELNATIGIDYRIAQIQHFEEVRDLLGGAYFNNTSSAFDTTLAQQQKHLGDKMYYWETNDLNWFGAYVQSEYSKDLLTAYGMYGWTIADYKYINNFLRAAPGSNDPLSISTNNLTGFQLKGGISYRLSSTEELFANAGDVSKVPIYDAIIQYSSNSAVQNLKNEQFLSGEAGLNSHLFNNNLTLKVDGYYTVWLNQAFSRQITNSDGSSGYVFLTGLNSLHEGLEFESAYESSHFYRFDAAFSLGYWKYTSDASGTFQDYSNPVPTQTYYLYVKGLMVGDAPQTQLALRGTVQPVDDMECQLVFRFNANYFSNWTPAATTTPNQGGQVWKTPSYTIWDFHFNYKLPIGLSGVNAIISAHIFNLFNAVYVQDANDDSQYNSYDAIGQQNHSASDAEVFLGLPRTFNLGVSFSY
jgi:hypothetical protein